MSRRTGGLQRASALLGVLAFWGGLSIAMRRYPSEFDWRYMTISSLVYKDRDPGGYRWAWGGILLCALGGLYWTTLLRGRAERSDAQRPGGTLVLGLGYLCMVCCALLPGRMIPVPRGHELLAIAAFLGICVGTVRLAYSAAQRSPPLRVYAAAVAGFALLPIVLGGMVQAYVSYARPELPWVSLQWRARGLPVALSFAFWEWSSCAVLSAYTALLCATGVGFLRPPDTA